MHPLLKAALPILAHMRAIVVERKIDPSVELVFSVKRDLFPENRGTPLVAAVKGRLAQAELRNHERLAFGLIADEPHALVIMVSMVPGAIYSFHMQISP